KIYSTENILNIHSWWFDILVSYGVVFFCIYVIFYMHKIYISYKKVKNTNSVFNKIYTSFLLVFVIVSNTSSTFFTKIWIWIFLTIIFILSKYNQDLDKSVL